MNSLLKTFMVVGLLVLAMGLLIGGPAARAGDDTRPERSDLDLSRHDRGELWDDDSHRAVRDRHREREFNRDHEREGDSHRETHREREMQREREGDRDRDSLREQFRDHDRDRERVQERETQDD